MKKTLLTAAMTCFLASAFAQTNPAITKWLVNTRGTVGRHYVSGNSTPITDTAQANVQQVRYSTNYVYINASGVPSYIVGPYLDRNPSLATNRNWLFKIPLNPTPATTNRAVGMGQIGVFVNGVPMYNYADGKSYNNGGIWHQDAIFFERAGFDCAKGHPSPVFSGGPGGTLVGGSYHHHQNPSAFNLDKVVLSTVCNLYLADGLYVMDSTRHSPLLGFAFDGYPIYGAFAYTNTNGTGAITRMRSSYRTRNITQRTTLPNGTQLTSANYGPAVNSTYPLGAYMEDYEYVAGSGDLDEHNGRFCVTPEYPNGIYCYFTTVDANWNSMYPYILGPTYYGNVETSNLPGGPGSTGTSVVVNEPVTTFIPTGTKNLAPTVQIGVYPNPASEFAAIQIQEMVTSEVKIELFDLQMRKVQSTIINPGSTIAYLDLKTVYEGEYIVRISSGTEVITKKLIVKH